VKYWTRLKLEGWEQSIEAVNKHFLLHIPQGEFWTWLPMSDFEAVAAPLIVSFIRLGFKVENVAIIQAIGRGLIHVDDTDMIARVNVPLKNCENSFTAFYSAGSKSIEYRANRTFWRVNPKDCRMVNAVKLTEPTVLRISEPHAVICHSLAPRYSLTLRVTPDPGILLI